jgi:hypothetical protein
MNNAEVENSLNDCFAELSHVRTLVDGLGIANNIALYLTRYAIIRACGTIEQAFKSILCDYCLRRSKKQVKRFLDRRVRESSSNPSYSNICKLAFDFDVDWQAQFKTAINASPDKTVLMTSLTSLVDARNQFAHGGSPSASIADVLVYFGHSRTVIEVLDSKVT